MANIKSAKKRIRSNKKKASYNLHHISKVKKLLKQISKRLGADSTKEEKKEMYSKLQKVTDKAISKKSISASKGAKIKSRYKKKIGT